MPSLAAIIFRHSTRAAVCHVAIVILGWFEWQSQGAANAHTLHTCCKAAQVHGCSRHGAQCQVVQAANPELAGPCDICMDLLSGWQAAEKTNAHVAISSQVWVGGLNNGIHVDWPRWLI